MTIKSGSRPNAHLEALRVKHEQLLCEFAALDEKEAETNNYWEKIEKILDAAWTISDQIMAADARTPDDVLVKARTLLGCWCISDEFTEPLEEYLSVVFSDLERIVGGGRSAESAMHLTRLQVKREKLDDSVKWSGMYKRCGLAPARGTA